MIDRSRWFFCETLTPLYYTRVYRELSDDERRRYNQLTGMLSNELILRLETGFLDRTLAALARRRDRLDDDLITRLRSFREDEREHARTWRELNRQSAPEWYARGDGHFVRTPLAVDLIASTIARYPLTLPVVFWIQLAQEERAIAISARCLRVPADRMEPSYAAAYRAHVRDEVRHVQIDRELIERFHAPQSMLMRRATAAMFRSVVSRFFLTPAGSTRRVIRALVAEHPRLEVLLPRIWTELAAVVEDPEYHDMMYSRRTTPITFALFDRFPEFHVMATTLMAYRQGTLRRPA